MITMIKKVFLISLISLLWVVPVNAYELTGNNLIEPRYYEGDLLIYNEGHISYSIYANDFYLGTIDHNQGMYVNESFDYKLYGLTNPVSDFTIVNVEKRINQYWYIAILLMIGIVAVIKVYKVITK